MCRGNTETQQPRAEETRAPNSDSGCGDGDRWRWYHRAKVNRESTWRWTECSMCRRNHRKDAEVSNLDGVIA